MRRRPGATVCAGIIAFTLIFPYDVRAQAELTQAQETAARLIDELESRQRADRASVTVRELNAATGGIWASGDKQLILRLQNVWVSAALREADVPREIGGRLLTYLLRNVVDGPVNESTAWAALALGQAYLKDAERLREGGHYALANSIAIAEALERNGNAGADALQTRARAYALLGQSLLQAGRVGQATYHLRKALALADAAQFSRANRDGVSQLLSYAEHALLETPAPRPGLACGPDDLANEARMRDCLDLADRLWADGDLGGVDKLLARLTADVECGSVENNEMDAVRGLHFARLLLHGPDSDALAFTICGLTGRLNANGRAPYAAIVAWPLLHAHVQRSFFQQRMADVAAHTARRFMRDFNDSFAWLALETTITYVRSANRATDEAGDLVKLRRQLIQSAIAFDMAYIAHRNEWFAVRDFYVHLGVIAVEQNDSAQIETIYDALAMYFNEDYGFKAPTPAAAMEVFARVARSLPATHPQHKMSIVIWPRLEQLYRSDEARASSVAKENLAIYRNLPDADPAVVAMLLQTYADTASEIDLDKSFAARREALEIVTGTPGNEALRIDLLFEVERDRRALGDTPGATTYFQEAVALRRSTPGLDVRTAARVDLRLAVRMFNDGDRIGARALAEAALARVIDDTKGYGQGWARSSPAKILAEIVAADGDLARARALYEEYVFPFTDKAIAAGEAVPIETRLELAALEAIHGPTAQTVTAIRDLISVAQRRASSARDIQERGWRSLAIAHLGLNNGRDALDAARRAFALKPNLTSQVRDEAADRRLSETFVSAAWRAQ